MEKDVWMASVDLKDAFFTVHVHISSSEIFQI